MSVGRQSAPILLVHGSGGGPWEWDVWKHELEARCQTVRTVDLEPASSGLESTSFAHYSDQVTRAAASLGDRPTLIGASLGGLLCVVTAVRVEVSALILVNPMPPAPFHRQFDGAAPFPPVIPWGSTASVEATRESMPDADDATVALATRHWRDESGQVLNTACAGIDIERPDCPILIIAGTDDADIPLQISKDLAGHWSADFVTGRGVSHVGPLLGTRASEFAHLASACLHANRI